ncbi:TVP38/TMEM64 family protein [Streptomyces sp. ST2-7A]|uniref:TVP38/TMEM64 family protein n=1 Tax=Streptomyces sp. ST2-7A TaxID=2907214 RepID=UPI001F1D4185|nr:VTT domain-containing protein [Streptomyces sp. ST2-7A]MCE7079410.1 VTT domain-containing protein [Streptomyces sp. ST2-7A]
MFRDPPIPGDHEPSPDPAGTGPSAAARWWTAGLVALALVGVPAAVAGAFALFGAGSETVTAAGVAEFLEAVPAPWVPVFFVLGYALLTALMVPRPLMNLVAGGVLGAVVGTLAAVVGTVLGAAIGFTALRRWGRAGVRRRLPPSLVCAADRWTGRRGFTAVVVARLIPMMPFPGVTAAAAFGRIGPATFLTATTVGTIPLTTAYCVAASRADQPSSPVFLTAVGIIALAWAASVVITRRGRRPGRGRTTGGATGGSIRNPTLEPGLPSDGPTIST